MTGCDEFSEICITLNAKEYSEIFTSEVADFTNEAIEFAESGAIIIRTSKDMKFINALLAHLQGFCKDLSAINNQNITFSHTITKKQNRDWIEEYKRGIKALRCGKFYIYPPWEKPLGNSVLGMQFRTKIAESSLDSATLSPLSLDSFRKRAAPPTSLPLRAKSCRFSLLGGEPRFSASSKKSAGGTTAPFDSDFLHHEAGEFSGASHGFNADSANLQNSQNLRGNPYYEKTQKSQGGLPRSLALARNDEFNRLPREQSSLAMTKNKDFAESSLDSADSTTNAESDKNSIDSAPSTHEANSSIADEFLGFCEASDADKTNGLSRKRAEAIPKKSLRDAEFATINILLEPSLAFGTGHHASTFMCIEAIQALDLQYSLKNKKLLDFGCGSGILALCAEKLGAKVSLCDIDELAIAESTKNFNNNNATISHIWQGGIADRFAKKGAKSGIYDIIVANIIASVLIEQKDNIDSSLKRGGIVVLSGILDIYKDEVLARFSDFVPLSICQSDEWICATLQKL